MLYGLDVLMCLVWISEQKGVSLYSVYWLVFLSQTIAWYELNTQIKSSLFSSVKL